MEGRELLVTYLLYALAHLSIHVTYSLGLMELPVKQLSQPPRESRLLHEADPTFVQNLKTKMLADPSTPGATPMAVLCTDMEVLTDFNLNYKSVYKYEVLGGL